jgi:hypothetical protein
MVGANQNPYVEKRSSVDLVAATTTQYTGMRKYSATTVRMPVTMMVDARVERVRRALAVALERAAASSDACSAETVVDAVMMISCS